MNTDISYCPCSYSVIIPGEQIEHGPYYSKRVALLIVQAAIGRESAQQDPEACLIRHNFPFPNFIPQTA